MVVASAGNNKFGFKGRVEKNDKTEKRTKWFIDFLRWKVFPWFDHNGKKSGDSSKV